MGNAVLPPGLSRGVLEAAPAVGQCARCNYDLKGLRVGGRCPECGATIAKRRGEGTLGQAPDSYLAPLALSAWGAFAGYTTLWIAFLGLLIYELAAGLASPWLVVVAVIPAAILIAGAWGVTRRRVFGVATVGQDPAREWRWLRWTVRIGSLMALLAIWSAFFWVRQQTALTPSYQSLVWFWLYFFGVGAGVLALFFYVSLLAAWSEDDGLAGRCRALPWILAASMIPFGLALGYTPFAQHGLASYIIARVGWLLVLTAWAFGSLVLYQFAMLVVWARRNAETAVDSELRKHERILERIREGQAKPEPAPMKVPRAPAPHTPQGNYFQGGGGGETYGIAEPGADGTTIPPR